MVARLSAVAGRSDPTTAIGEEPGVTMRHLIAPFAAYQRVRGFSDRTVDRRTWSLTLWATHLEQHATTEPTATDVETFLARWPSAQSRYSVRSDLHQFYRWAIMRDHLTVDPTLKTDPPRLPRRAVTPVESSDVRLLVDVLTGPVRTMVMLGAFGGLRVSEIAALDAADVRLDRRALVVRNGKGGKDRVIPLAPELVAELAAVTPSSGPLFPGVSGQGVSWRIRTEFRRHGINRRPHDLRAGAATALARRANGNLVAVAQFLGHESVVTTQRYVRWEPESAHLVADLHGPTAA
jgi:integrase